MACTKMAGFAPSKPVDMVTSSHYRDESNICHTTILWWHVTHVASGKKFDQLPVVLSIFVVFR